MTLSQQLLIAGQWHLRCERARGASSGNRECLSFLLQSAELWTCNRHFQTTGSVLGKSFEVHSPGNFQ